MSTDSFDAFVFEHPFITGESLPSLRIWSCKHLRSVKSQLSFPLRRLHRTLQIRIIILLIDNVALANLAVRIVACNEDLLLVQEAGYEVRAGAELAGFVDGGVCGAG